MRMKRPRSTVVCSLVAGPVLATLAFSPLVSSAANITWDGDGDANAGGLWEAGVNWSADAIPATVDNAILGDVTAGTREVTISSGFAQTINRLTITQTTAGAINVLNVNDDFTISTSGANSPFAISATAGQQSIVTNIADGKTLRATNASSGMSGVLFDGTLNLGAGSVFRLEALGAASDLVGATFGGPVNVSGAGAAIVLQGGRFVQNPVFNGAISIKNAGASLSISALNGAGAAAGVGGAVTFNGNDGSGNAIVAAAGTELTFSVGTGAITQNFTNRVNLAGASGSDAGAKMTVGSLAGGSSTRILNFNAGLAMGAGARLDVMGPTLSVNLVGTSTLGTGAALLVQSDNAQGAWNFSNAGILTMDGASLTFDWAATGNNTTTNPLGRRFINTGTWTVKNASNIAFITTTGRSTSGFGFATNNENSGTMNIESGSSVGFSDLYNTGTLNVGSSNGVVSDAVVNLGSPSNLATSVALINGLTSAGAAGAAIMNINGDVYLGRTTPNSTTTFANGVNVAGSFSSTGSVLNIGNGTVPVTFTLANTNAGVTNAAGNTVNVNSGGTLLLKSLVTTNSNGTATILNNGIFNHLGRVQLQGGFNGTRSITTGSTGTYRVNGTGAVIEALPQLNTLDPTNVSVTSFVVNGGLLTGASSHDRLTFTNSTGRNLTSHNFMTIAMSGGEITAGAGTNGSGASSIGALEFVNTNITLTGATKLSFDIGGLGNDAAPLDGDFNPVLTFDRILLGAGRTFALGTGAVLDIWLTNGFFTETAQTYTLIDTGLGGEGTVSGSFATLLFQGQALDADQYTVHVGGGQMSITLAAGLGTPIPEPSASATLAAVFIAAAVGLRRRRRV